MGLVRICNDIMAERRAQDEKWGANRHLDWNLWLSILVEEVGEVAREVVEGSVSHDPSLLRRELIQVAAVAVAIVEDLDSRDDLAGPEKGSNSEARAVEPPVAAQNVPDWLGELQKEYASVRCQTRPEPIGPDEEGE